MDKEEFKNSLHYYSIPNEQRNELITTIDNMSKITLNEKNERNLFQIADGVHISDNITEDDAVPAS